MKKAARRKEPDAEKPWLEDVLDCIGDGKAVRKDLPGGGRLHIDRALPFLCVHIGTEPDGPVAREIAQSNASYLLAPDSETAQHVVDAVGPALKQRLGAFMVLDVGELAQDDLLSDDAPYLPPFAIDVSFSREPAAKAAADVFAAAAIGIEAKFRTPQIDVREASPDSAGGFRPAFPSLTVRFAPIYRRPESEDIYPELRERLIANMVDAGLQAFAAFIEATKAMTITTHRALGRKAFIDAVVRTDRSIDEVASSFDFLLAVTPINADAAWEEFIASSRKQEPRFLYRPLSLQVEAAKRKLFSIAFDHLEDPVLYSLYREKQQELDLQLSMLSARQTPKFVEFGRALYCPVEPALLRVAQHILTETAAAPPDASGDTADCYFVDRRARTMIAGYHRQHSDFDVSVELRDDLPSGLMVSGHRLLISRSTLMDRRRVEPLLSHEIGVHLLTYFNGSAQGLRLFRTGLAGYEGMQEGLAVFAEYLSGGMTRERLRLIAARVVGVSAMLDGASFAETFEMLTRDHDLHKAAAFNLVLRVYRGGGLAKDAIYLRGLLELLGHLEAGGALEPFWMGKIAASHFSVMQELADRGLLRLSAVKPAFLDHPDARARLEKAQAGLSPLDMVQPQEP